MSFIIYGHRCKQTDKWYIGQTCNTIEQRSGKDGIGYLRKSKYGYSQPKFASAIIKYGWENFEHTTLATAITKKDANEKERQYIKQFNSINNGYNIEPGGNCEYVLGDETKSKISKNHADVTGANNPNYGKHWDEYYKNRFREKEVGKIISEEQKIKTSNSLKGKKNSEKQNMLISQKVSKPVICVETNIKYPSIKNAAESLGIKNGCAISACCLGHRLTCNGFHWKYADENNIEIAKRKRAKILCVEKGVVYNNSREAANSIGAKNLANIVNCCKGKKHTSGGYHWKFV